MDNERDDDNLADLIDPRVHLNLEINKDEVYWSKGLGLIGFI